MDQIDELLTRRVQDIVPSAKNLAEVLRSGKKIKLYQGFDPSKPNLHIGHLVGLQQLKMFQDLGHEVIFLIGDFTGMIGDPTDKRAARPKLTKEEVLVNAQTYKEQAGKILRFDGPNAAKIEYNSTWLSKLSFADILDISSNFTIQQLLERDMFQARLKENKPIFLHEFLYPLMVTYDALALEVDLEIGGNDQLFNMTVGRNYLKDKIGKNKFALTTKLLTDKDGNKIGKTSGNAINLFNHPNDLFGQIMSLPDGVVINAFTLATSVDLDNIKLYQQQMSDQPMTVKKALAFELVSLCHGESAAKATQIFFESSFQKKELPSDIPTLSLSSSASSLLAILKLANLADSNAQLKRVIQEGGVEYNGQKMTDATASLTPKTGDTIKFGKHLFRKIIIV